MRKHDMKIVICDDEKAYVNDIKKNVELFLQEKNIEPEFDLFVDSQLLLSTDTYYNIAFLDIEMGEVSGIKIAEHLKKINPHIIIFIITAYNQYLDEAMDLSVFRFISKPLDVRRLVSSLEKALLLLDNIEICFYLKNNNEHKKVFADDILYVEIVGHSTKVVTVNGEYITDYKMSFWKEKLTASYFYQIHNSFIANLKYITQYKRDTVVLKEKYTIPISYRTQASFKKYFLKYNSGR